MPTQLCNKLQDIPISSGNSNKTSPLSANYEYHIKCYDQDNPEPPTYLPRGEGGVVIIWPKHLSHFIKRLPDGSERIVAIRFEPEAREDALTIINAYFPCRGSTHFIADFPAILDQIQELICKFNEDSTVVLCGDFNASLTTPKYASGSGSLQKPANASCRLPIGQHILPP